MGVEMEKKMKMSEGDFIITRQSSSLFLSLFYANRVQSNKDEKQNANKASEMVVNVEGG